MCSAFFSNSWVLRHLGGFFIKRKLDHSSGKDELYKCLLQEVWILSLAHRWLIACLANRISKRWKTKWRNNSFFWFFSHCFEALSNHLLCCFSVLTCSMDQTSSFWCGFFALSGLEITPVRSSGTSRFSPRASNFVFLLAPRARAQASRSPTKCFIIILRRKGKF